MKKIISVIAALAVCLSLTACNKAPQTGPFAGLELVDASGTLNRIHYDTLDFLEEETDVAVIGRFIDDTVQEIYYQGGAFSNITSFNTIEVTKVLLGDVEVGDQLKIAQSYGVLDDRLISFSKLTPMQKGDEWIFFLVLSGAPGEIYWCTGDTDGRYPTKNSSDNEVMPLAKSPELGVYKKADFNKNIYNELVKKYDL